MNQYQSPIWLGTNYGSSLDFIPELHAHSFSDCQFCSQRLALAGEAIMLQYSIASLFYSDSSSKYSVKYFLQFGSPKSLTAYIYVNNKHYFPVQKRCKKAFFRDCLAHLPHGFPSLLTCLKVASKPTECCSLLLQLPFYVLWPSCDL